MHPNCPSHCHPSITMELADLLAPNVEPEVIGTGYGFAEGPAADAEGNLYFSDGKHDSIWFYSPGRSPELFVGDSTDANGMLFNQHGELCVCEGAAYRVVAFDIRTRQKRVLASQIDGQHFNEPNDLAIDRSDGVYFSDPNYSHRGQPTVMKEDAYYVTADGRVSRVSTVCIKPNGLLLTPDQRTLFLADSRGQRIYRYDVTGPGQLTNERKWLEVGANPDGMTLDVLGNLYVCCGRAGVKVYRADGSHLGHISLPYASNCCFGGRDFHTLFITSEDKVFALPMKIEGTKPLTAAQ